MRHIEWAARRQREAQAELRLRGRGLCELINPYVFGAPAGPAQYWNPADKHASVILSNGNLTGMQAAGAGGMFGVRALLPFTGDQCWGGILSGITGSAYIDVGLSKAGAGLGFPGGPGGNDAGWYGASPDNAIYFNNASAAAVGSLVDSDFVVVAYRASTGKVWWWRNGAYVGGGNPAADTGAVITGLVGTLHPYVAFNSPTARIDAVFSSADLTAAGFTLPAGFTGFD